MTAARALTPYDKGTVLEPFPWSPDGDHDRYGRVDFEDCDGTTVLSVRVVPDETTEGNYVVEVTTLDPDAYTVELNEIG